MKKTILLFLAALAISVAHAQDDKFVKVMEKAIASMDTLKTYEDWLSASNRFERIAQKETKQWLPQYYVGFCQIMAFNTSQDAAMQELMLKKAEEYVNKADALQPDHSEIYLLKSMVSGLYIRLNPMVNGQKYAPMASAQLEKARRLDTGNPRVDMQEGLTLFFTPPQWGGDKVKAKALLETAASKYESFVPATSIHPNWGKKANEMFLEMAGK